MEGRPAAAHDSVPAILRRRSRACRGKMRPAREQMPLSCAYQMQSVPVEPHALDVALRRPADALQVLVAQFPDHRSEEHTSELQSLMPISYAVLCLKTKNTYRLPTPNLYSM